MIVCEDRALSECIRDCCKRTGIAPVMLIAGQIQFSDDVLLSYPLAVLLLLSLMHEFARAAQAIIHPALKSKKFPDRSNDCQNFVYPLYMDHIFFQIVVFKS
jgi:hypothetical protein